MRNELFLGTFSACAVLLILLFRQSAMPPSIAVVYIFHLQDNSSMRNLQYFIEEGISADLKQPARYFVIIQDDVGKDLSGSLPNLPDTAQYVHHENSCYDWGTLGWFIFQSEKLDVTKFKYFVIINSSVRGPFIPPYVKRSWLDILISLISPSVKLAGPTISCEATGHLLGHLVQNPHVQSYAMVTDSVGLETLYAAGVFTCRNNRWRTIYYAEVESSRSILFAGYTIESLLLRYTNMDWRHLNTWKCNSEYTPLNNNSFYGITIHPFDAMFVKVKDELITTGILSAVVADKFDSWMHNHSAQAISRNAYLDMKPKLIQKMLERGPKCFDVEYYLTMNTDIGANAVMSVSAWQHYVSYGQFEGRHARFRCPTEVQRQ